MLASSLHQARITLTVALTPSLSLRTLPLQVVLLALAVLSLAQYRDSRPTAAILSEQRYLAGDGTFGAAYSQEDGVEFKEE